jgi:hypothetical protein
MGTRESGKATDTKREPMARRGTREVLPITVRKPPLQPRRGKRRVLSASVALFLCWLAMLAWLAFS